MAAVATREGGQDKPRECQRGKTASWAGVQGFVKALKRKLDFASGRDERGDVRRTSSPCGPVIARHICLASRAAPAMAVRRASSMTHDATGTFAGVPRMEMLRSATVRSIDVQRHDAVLAKAKDVAIRDDGVDVRTHGKLPAVRGWRERKSVRLLGLYGGGKPCPSLIHCHDRHRTSSERIAPTSQKRRVVP